MGQGDMWRQRPPKKFGAQGEKSRLRPGPSSHHTQPSGATLTCKGSEPADWAASSGSLHHPRRLAPPGGGGRRKRLGVRRAPAREARSEPGRVATLTSPSTRRTPAAVEANSMPPWLPIAHAITNVTREPKGRGLGEPNRPALKNTKGCGAHFARRCLGRFTIGPYMC